MDQCDGISDHFIENLINFSFEENKWKPESQPDDITSIFSRDWPNTNFKAFKLVTECKDCSMNSLLNLLDEKLVERHAEWNDTYMGGNIIEKLDENTNIQYWKFKVPFPFSNRDFVVIHRKVIQEKQIALVEKSTTHEDFPVEGGFVRCDLVFNLRILKEGTDGVLLTYVNVTDMGGNIPISIVNKLNPTTSFKEVQHIKSVCKLKT